MLLLFSSAIIRFRQVSHYSLEINNTVAEQDPLSDERKTPKQFGLKFCVMISHKMFSCTVLTFSISGRDMARILA
jgi:hypothetical protein